jgi:CheY-like chemotaxis protein
MNSTPRFINRRVLVIDDVPTIHEDFHKILSPPPASDQNQFDALEAAIWDTNEEEKGPAGFEIESAFQGEEGLAKVQHALENGRPYALAFVDMRMPPGWDGVETITRLWLADPNLQIVICTAYSDYSWEEIVRQLGRRSNLVVLKKPFDNIEVVQLCETLTHKWSLTQQLLAPKPAAGIETTRSAC